MLRTLIPNFAPKASFSHPCKGRWETDEWTKLQARDLLSLIRREFVLAQSFSLCLEPFGVTAPSHTMLPNLVSKTFEGSIPNVLLEVPAKANLVQFEYLFLGEHPAG